MILEEPAINLYLGTKGLSMGDKTENGTEGVAYCHTISVTCKILEATRASFLEFLLSSVDIMGSGKKELHC